jgi:prepilin-type N-terminal cleavage/methylation domain-containing protein
MRLCRLLAVGEAMKRNEQDQGGFTLIELMIAIMVLVVGVLGGMTMIIIGMTRNNSNRVDTTATNVAQTILEDISGVPTSNNTPLTITDCLGTNLSINTAPGGAALSATGDVRWDVAAPAGYGFTYTVCGDPADPNNGLQTPYDVRWNVQAAGGGGFGKLVTVSARQPFSVGKSGISWLPPVTLRTVVSL